MLKNDAAHGLTVSPPNRDKLTMSLTSSWACRRMKPKFQAFSASC